MLTDHELLTAVRAESLSPLAVELVDRFAADVAAIDAVEAAWLGQPVPVSIALDPKPIA